MKRFNFMSFAAGALTVVVLKMFQTDAPHQWAMPWEPCGYVFPHSGRCTRRNHHSGSHY